LTLITNAPEEFEPNVVRAVSIKAGEQKRLNGEFVPVKRRAHPDIGD